MPRLALCGCSLSVATRYVHAAHRFRDVKIVAACHEDSQVLANCVQRFPALATASGLELLLKQRAGEFDAVVVQSSMEQRGTDAQVAASSGKHILIASPLAGSSQQAQAIVAACAMHNVQTMIANSIRMQTGLLAIKQAVDGGKLGTPALLRTQAWRGEDSSADSLFAMMVERLDLASWLFGAWPTDLLVTSSKNGPSGSTVPNVTHIQCGFPGDAMALLTLAESLRGQTPYDCTSLIGSSGAAYWDMAEQAQLLFGQGQPQAMFTDEGIVATVNELREFRDMIVQNRKSSVPIESGVTAIALAEAAVHSASRSQPFELHPSDTIPVYKSRGADPTSEAPPAVTQSTGKPSQPAIVQSPRASIAANDVFRVAVLSVIKHDYVARGVASHPRFELVVVADDPGVPDWVHQRNQQFADEKKIPYMRNVEQALKDFNVHVAVVSTEAERHCDLSQRAANLGIHVIQDKPMSNRLSACDDLVQAIERNGVTFSMWNRNMLPAVVQATDLVRSGAIGKVLSINADFYFSKDAGPPKGSRKPHEPLIDWLEFQRAAHVDGSDGAVGKSPIGELQNEGIYPLAYIHQITGGKFLRAYAKTATAFHQVNVDNGVEDLGTVTLEMSSGMLATLAIGRIGAASHPDLGEIKLWIIGTEGSLVVAEARPEVALHYRGQPEKEFRRRRVAIDNDFLIMDNFARALDGEGSTILDVRTSRHITSAIQAALRSAKSGRLEIID